MKKSELYREGARLPEQLSRLLFLEGLVAERRVLEVGARSDAVARFLLEMGASRVVCASEDKAVIESLRRHSDLDRVDYRVIRPGVLPGDDGAFDLVIDTTLPYAVGHKDASRLAEIARLLSDDGFALTSLTSANTAGLATLLGGSAGPPPVSYRELMEALRPPFELVQVYFQSLLLGYLFGSFDVEPGDGGIAPNTLLMHDEPEPAGSYLFAFGNAIPVIEDVSLVQIPFDALLEAYAAQRAAAVGDPHAAFTLRPGAAIPPGLTDDAGQELAQLRLRARELEQAVGERNQTIEELERALDDARRDVDENARGEGRTALPSPADDGPMQVLARELDDARSVAFELEARLRITLGEIERIRELHANVTHDLAAALFARDEALASRDAVLVEAAALDEQSTEMLQRLSALERELREGEAARELAEGRAVELEEALLSLDNQRGAFQTELLRAQTEHEGDRQRFAAEREVLRAELAQRRGGEQELENQQLEAEALAERARSALTERVERVEAAMMALAERNEALQGELAQALDDVAARDAALRQARAALSEAALDANQGLRSTLRSVEQERDALATELSKARTRIQTLETDGIRLADGVKALVAERDALAARAPTHDDGLARRLQQAEQAREIAHNALHEAGRQVEEHARKLKITHTALEDARREIAVVRDSVQEISGQREALQGVVHAREREIEELRTTMQGLRVEVERLTLVAAEQNKRAAELEAQLQAATTEAQSGRHHEEEVQRRLAASRAEVDDAFARLAEAERRRKATEDEALRLLSELEAAEQRTEQARTEARTELQHGIDVLRAELSVASTSLRALETDAGERLAKAFAEHEATRDELAASTQAFLRLEELVERERIQARDDASAASERHSEHEAALKSAEEAWAAAEVRLEELTNAYGTLQAELLTTRKNLLVLESERDEARDALAAAIDSERATAALAQQEAEAARVRLDEAIAAARTRDEDLRAAQDVLRGMTQGKDALQAELGQTRQTLERVIADADRARVEAEQTSAAMGLLADERDSLIERMRGAEQAVLDAEQARVSLAAELDGRSRDLAAARDELSGLETALARASVESAEGSRSVDALRNLVDVERARGDLFFEELQEAVQALNVERTRGDLFKAGLEEAQQEAGVFRDSQEVGAARAELFLGQLHEARMRLELEAARGDLLQAQLEEAQVTSSGALARAGVLAAQLEEAQTTFQARRDAYERVLEAERVRAAALVNDADSASTRAAFDKLAAEAALQAASANRAELEAAQGELDAMRVRLEAAERTTLQWREAATSRVESAERERDSALHEQTLAFAAAQLEAGRRASMDEELERSRAELSTLRARVAELDNAVPAQAGSDAELQQLRERLDALERTQRQKDAKIAEQADRINRLTERLVRTGVA